MKFFFFNSTIFFTIISLFYCILLFVTFFTKKKIKNSLNEVFSSLIIITFMEIVSELFLCIFAGSYIYHNIIYILLNKLYLVLLLSWMYMFMVYVLNISIYEKNKDAFKKLINIVKIAYFIFLLLIIILPIEFCLEDNYVIYSYGKSILALYIACFISIVGMVYCLLKNYKDIKNKKYYPILSFLAIGFVSSLVQFFYPSLLLTTSMEAFVTMLMFFTIENPDLKLIEEIKNSKEISDKSNEEKTLFLYNMTRDIKLLTDNINTKVNNILNEDSIDNIKEEVEYIKEDTNNFISMVNDVLDISNLDSANIKVYNDKYNIKLLLKELNTMYKEKSNKKGLELRTNIASNIPEYLYGDVLNLKKVLMILMDNSLNNTNKGYIEFNVNTIIKSNVCRLIISIEDSGSGMNASKINKILNKINNDINEDTLTSAKKIITLIGGTIMVSSQIDEGTKTTVVIDQKIVKTEDNKKITRYEKEIKDKRILFVDDNESSKKIIEKILNKEKYKYEILTSGKECLDKVRNMEKYDIIFLDEEMPYLNGYEVITKLNNIKNFNVPVILLTKNKDIEYDDEYKEYGFKDYIIKPINEDNVIEKINKYTS